MLNSKQLQTLKKKIKRNASSLSVMGDMILSYDLMKFAKEDLEALKNYIGEIPCFVLDQEIKTRSV